MLSWLKSLLKIAGVFLFLLGITIGVCLLTLRILIPPERVEVPCVVGKDLKEALLLVSERDLALKVVDRKYSSEIPEGIIISQVPSPEVRVRKGREIEVVISEGKKSVVVPSVVGKKLIEARIYLSQRGLKIGNISYIYDDLPEGKVSAQDPPPQVEMNREEGINLLVSLGPEEKQYYMPDFTGSKIKRVKDLAEKIPLRIGRIKEVPSSEEEGIVLSQSPVAGSMVSEKTLVEFEVSAPYKKEGPVVQKERWILTCVDIPPGFTPRRVRVTIIDLEGVRSIDYGKRNPGERLWISSRLVGKGEIRVYIEGRLVKVKRVK